MKTPIVPPLLAAAIMCAGSLSVDPALAHPRQDDSPGVDYTRDIEPLFRTRCYSCHGSEVEESGLRMDVRRRALEGGDGGAIIVAGDPQQSRLIAILEGTDEFVEQMPPAGEGTPFNDHEIERVVQWIRAGAEWPVDSPEAVTSRHWAYQPIESEVGASVAIGDGANPIDGYIRRRLSAHGLSPSASASRETLIRRLYLDLLGLPPSPVDVDAFVADTRPGAYERLVDRVLASPHFGERWGRHWLDLARYADSDGYEKDRVRPNAWRYREWVIQAINADMPYDEFSRQQIAGDLLQQPSESSRTAVGFHRNTLHNTEGGTDQEEDRVKKTVDRTNTYGAIWLGLTVECAQCHSHKYDAITQREYFSLYAFFNQMDEVNVTAPATTDRIPFERTERTRQRQREQLTDALERYLQQEALLNQRAWEQQVTSNATHWYSIDFESMHSRHDANFESLLGGSFLVTGPNESSDRYDLTFTWPENSTTGSAETTQRRTPRYLTAIRLEVLPHDSLVKNGPGRADNGNFVLTSVELSDLSAESEQRLSLQAARADFSQQNWEVTKAINEDPSDGWAVSPKFGERHVAVFELAEPLEYTGQTLRLVLDQQYSGKPHNLGRFRLTVSDSAVPVELDALDPHVIEAAATPADQRSPDQIDLLRDAFRSVDPKLKELNQKIAEFDKQAKGREQFQAQSVRERDRLRETFVHIRGDFLRPGQQVSAAVPSVLDSIDSLDAQPNRLDLVNWTFADSHPLTARVTVNRIWQRLMGRGIVASIDDFGTRGDAPTHPKLLDWLAGEIKSGDWSVKQLIRRIVLSETYRQVASQRDDLRDVDPLNTLLARQHRRRVEAEIVRDLALSAAGLLDSRIGGPSVRPPQPAEYSSLTYAGSAKWTVSPGGDAYRRGLYTFFQRTSPYPMLTTFDCPDSNRLAVQRQASNTPIQSLTLWNDRVFYAAAQAFALRLVRESESDEPGFDEGDGRRAALIDRAFRIALSRAPNGVESETLVAFHRKQQNALAADESAAAKLIAGIQSPADVSNAELAAWVLVTRIILNLDEFIVKE